MPLQQAKWYQTIFVLTVNVFFFLLGGGAVNSVVGWYLSFEPLANGELVRFAWSSSESISSCRRRRALFGSTFGDSHFGNNEFDSIFDTPTFILPIKDCGGTSTKWKEKKKKTIWIKKADNAFFVLHYINKFLPPERSSLLFIHLFIIC